MLQLMPMSATELKRLKCRPIKTGVNSHHKAGFTLLELIMGLGFMVVMSAVIAPNLQASLNAFRLHSALSSLAGKITVAHYKAMSGNTEYEVAVISSNSYQLEQLTSSNPRTFGLAAGEEAINLPSNVSFGYGTVTLAAGDAGEQPSLAQSSAIAFNSLGMPVDNNGNPTPANAFYLTCNGMVGAVTVSEAGKVESWLWNGSAWGEQ